MQSMLYNIEARMSYIVQTTGIDPSAIRPTPSPSSSLSPSLISDSPFADDDSLTDTDGSSVHTPQEGYCDPPFFYQQGVNLEDQFIDLESGLPRSPSPPKTPPTAKCIASAEYSLLNSSAARLRALLERAQSVERIAAADNATMLAVLEVKSRRRAWSSKDLLGRSVIELSGLASPTRSSPLARYTPVTPQTLAADARAQQSGIPRLGRPKLGAIRLTTIQEQQQQRDGIRSFPEDVFIDEEGMEIQIPHSSHHQRRRSANCIPFPQSEDFCSTAPQDSLHLFSPTESPGENPHVFHEGDYSCDPPAVPFHMHYDGFDASNKKGCDDFMLSLDLRSKPLPDNRRMGNTPIYECNGWISSQPMAQ